MNKIIVASVIISCLIIAACNKIKPASEEFLNETPSLPSTVYDYKGRFDQIPTNFNPSITPINNDLATLGRVLFYERKLSANNTVSCGTCHQQGKAFADGLSSSAGLAMGKTPRNSPTICNVTRQNRFFWDGREDTLVNMVLKPIGNHIEMGIADINTIVPKVQSLDYYKPLFTKAFGDESVSKNRIALALQEFVSSIVSFESKQDQENNMMNFADIYSIDERVGRQLFMVSLPCASCHTGDNFVFGWAGSQFQNIGLEEHYTDKGATFMNGGGQADMEGFFKVPTLRNIALTAPYMHDGRFKSLEEVVEFYTQNIQAHPQLSGNLQTGFWGGGIFLPNFPGDQDIEHLAKVESNATAGKFGEPLRFTLSDYQKKCLVAYLKTFTDTKMITEPMYSDPFRK